jgi:outer membrane biosynthesis protein TonB
LKKHKKGFLYHADTNLVFKSSTEKIVIGRLFQDDFISLDDEALELCEQNGFKYDETLVETEEAEETEEVEPALEPVEKKKSQSENSVNEEEKKVSQVKVEQERNVSSETKKAKEQPKEERKPPSVEPVRQELKQEPTRNESKEKSGVKDFNDLIEGMQNYVFGLQKQTETDKETIGKLENLLQEKEQLLVQNKKELEEVKRKLKVMLTAMQNDL